MRLNAQQIAGDLADSLVDGYQILLGATRYRHGRRRRCMAYLPRWRPARHRNAWQSGHFAPSRT